MNEESLEMINRAPSFAARPRSSYGRIMNGDNRLKTIALANAVLNEDSDPKIQTAGDEMANDQRIEESLELAYQR